MKKLGLGGLGTLTEKWNDVLLWNLIRIVVLAIAFFFIKANVPDIGKCIIVAFSHIVWGITVMLEFGN